ncbi:MAG: hypothetical protein ACK5ML_00620 [Lachnospiraceae bacterium]
MSVIHTVYDHYLSSYGNKRSSRFENQRKEDTEGLYDSFVRISKDVPLYKIRDIGQSFQQAINVKEYAATLKSALAEFAPYGKELKHSMFLRTAAESSNEEIASAAFSGQEIALSSDDYAPAKLTIEKLATPQINRSNMLYPSAQSFEPGRNHFDLSTESALFEFQFNINEEESNVSVLKRIALLVNNANIQIHAEVEATNENMVYLTLTSQNTGTLEDSNLYFEITPQASQSSIRAMKILGIDQVALEPSDARYSIDGTSYTSSVNSINVKNLFEVRLLEATNEGESVTIGFQSDQNAIANYLGSIVDSYNCLLNLTAIRVENVGANRLAYELGQTLQENEALLGQFGISQNNASQLEIDHVQLAKFLSESKEGTIFEGLTEIKDTLYKKADSISYDPLKYTDRLIVAYKNPGRSFLSPYNGSVYSGILIDNYL